MSNETPQVAGREVGTATAPRPLERAELPAAARAIAENDPNAALFLRNVGRVAGPGELPIEVYQAVIDAQGKALAEFFKSWAQSIEDNAREDRLASKRAQERNAEIKGLRRSAELMKNVLGHVKKRPEGRELAGKLEERLRPTLARLILLDGDRTAPPLGSRRSMEAVHARPTEQTQGLVPPSSSGGVLTPRR